MAAALFCCRGRSKSYAATCNRGGLVSRFTRASVAALSALGLTVAGLVGASSAAAKPIEQAHFHDVYDEAFTFCEGLDVWYHSEEDGNFLFNQRGSGLAYGGVTVRGTTTWTNLDTGGTFTNIWTVRDMDLKITYDEATDTLTIIGLATGSSRYYDADGKFVLADPGQIRYKILIDANGTPTDPSDDEFIADLGLVKGSTGRNDTQGRDFCEDLVLFTT
jgi:hypothetical protein